MFYAPEASELPHVFGATPGARDPSQPSRVLRAPGAILSFASFDPLSATRADLNNSRRHTRDGENPRSKRIVIEQVPGLDGGNFWRFVPRARLEQGVEDEGVWPRFVDLCGEIVHLSHDQWDIHKLDPEYDCFVRAPPNPTIISRKKGKEREQLESIHASQESGPSAPLFGKRRLPSPDSATRFSEDAYKRPRTTTVVSDSEEEKPHLDEESDGDDEEDEVEEIIDDDLFTPRPRPRRPSISHRSPSKGLSRSHNHKLATSRPERRERLARKLETYNLRPSGPEDEVMIDLTQDSTDSSQSPPTLPPPPPQARSVPTTPAAQKTFKRRASPTLSPFDGLGTSASNPIDITAEQPSFKRSRTVSPTAQRRQPQERQRGRGRVGRADRYQARKNDWNNLYYQKIMDGVYPEFQDTTHPMTQSQAHPIPEEDEPVTEEFPQEPLESTVPEEPGEQDPSNAEAMRQQFIEEARRKLAELEKDRPLWEEAARKRRDREAAEEAARHARREADARRAASEAAGAQERQRHQARAESERRAQQEQARMHAEPRAQEERERAEREQARRRHRQQEMRWSQGVWTKQRALERYKALSEIFDTAKFTIAEPLTFDIVPWPVLRAPQDMKVQDIDWTAVEEFFRAVRPYMRSQDYKTFIEKSHKRFHPDRWRARGLLKSIDGEELRGDMEVASNTVAQAVTPLWREVKGN